MARDSYEDVIDGLRVISQRRGYKIQRGDVIALERAIDVLMRLSGPNVPLKNAAHAGQSREGSAVDERAATTSAPADAAPSVGPWKECVYKHPDAPISEVERNAARWRFFASSPQTALMLGSKHDPNDKDIFWDQECDDLADEAMRHDATSGGN